MLPDLRAGRRSLLGSESSQLGRRRIRYGDVEMLAPWRAAPSTGRLPFLGQSAGARLCGI